MQHQVQKKSYFFVYKNLIQWTLTCLPLFKFDLSLIKKNKTGALTQGNECGQ